MTLHNSYAIISMSLLKRHFQNVYLRIRSFLAISKVFQVYQQHFEKKCSKLGGPRAGADLWGGKGWRPPPRDFSEPQHIVKYTGIFYPSALAPGN